MLHPRGLLLLACTLLPAPGNAQVTPGIGAASQYWVRGVPLSKGLAPKVSADWDGAGGWFAGAMVSRANVYGASAAGLAYGGVARRIAEGLSAEGGITAVRFAGAAEYGYHEVFAGLAARRASARLYYSPRYYGVYGRSLYGEVNGGIALGDNVELTLHAGRLQARAGRPALYYTPRAQSRTDVRIGVSGAWEGWTVQVAALAVRGDAAPYAVQARKAALTVGVLRSF